MLKKVEWGGMSFFQGGMTDVLLKIEEHLDHRRSAFLRVVDAETVYRRLKSSTNVKREDEVLVHGGLTAGLVAFRTGAFIRSLDLSFFLSMLANLLEDNSERALILSDRTESKLLDLLENDEAFRGSRRLTIEESQSTNQLTELFYATNAVFIISEKPTDHDYETYNELRRTSGRPVLWIQLPFAIVSKSKLWSDLKRDGYYHKKTRAEVSLALAVISYEFRTS